MLSDSISLYNLGKYYSDPMFFVVMWSQVWRHLALVTPRVETQTPGIWGHGPAIFTTCVSSCDSSDTEVFYQQFLWSDSGSIEQYVSPLPSSLSAPVVSWVDTLGRGLNTSSKFWLLGNLDVERRVSSRDMFINSSQNTTEQPLGWILL